MMHDFKNLNQHDPDNLYRWSKPILPWYKKIWRWIKLIPKIIFFAAAPFIAVVSIYAFVVIVFLQ